MKFLTLLICSFATIDFLTNFLLENSIREIFYLRFLITLVSLISFTNFFNSFGSKLATWSGPFIFLDNVKCFSITDAPNATAEIATLFSRV